MRFFASNTIWFSAQFTILIYAIVSKILHLRCWANTQQRYSPITSEQLCATRKKGESRKVSISSKFFALNFFEIERRKINRSDKSYEQARAKIKLRARRKTSNPAMIFALLNIALFGTNTPTHFLYGWTPALTSNINRCV